MQSKKDEKELQSFLEKVDDLDSILKDLTSADEEAQKRAIARADEEIAKQERLKEKKESNIGFDRTVINKEAFAEDKNSGPRFPEQNTSQENFLASLEADCQRRADARRKRHLEASVVKQRGNEAFNNGQFEDAIKLYTEATKIAKDLTPLYTNRAASYLKLNEHQKAIDDCDFALRIDESWVKAYVLKAKSLQKLNKYDEATEEFRKVVEIDKTKTKMIEGFLAELEENKRTHELEASVHASLMEQQQDSMTIANLISSIQSRMNEEESSTSDATSNLMYYAGGFRILQAQLVDEKSRTHFRTAGGFQMITGPGSVSRCLESEVNFKARAPPHQRDLVAATIALCTAACSQVAENLKTLLSAEGVAPVFLSFLSSQSEQVKRSAITFFHEVSLTPSGRSTIRATMDCARLSALLLQPGTRKADANTTSSATLLNMTLDKKYCDLLEKDFEVLLPLYQEILGEVGSACYEAMRIRMDSLNNLMRSPRMSASAGRKVEFRGACMGALGRCVDAFNGGLSNPCAMEQVLQLLRILLKVEKDERQSNDVTSMLSPLLGRVKDGGLLAECLGLVGLAVEQWSSCVDNLFAGNHGNQVFKHLFGHLKNNDLRTKTHSLKMLCCAGQRKPGYLQPLIQIDKAYGVLRGLLSCGDGPAERINQGHVALILGGLSSVEGGLEPILSANAEADVVRRLLVLCRDAPETQARANCSIALGKMAVYDSRFLAQLRKHDGINILARQNVDQFS